MTEVYNGSDGLYLTDNGTTTTPIAQLEHDIKDLEAEIEQTDITNPEKVEQLKTDYRHVLDEAGACGLDKIPILKVIAKRLRTKTE